MPDIGVPELVVILGIVIVLFGPSRLTDIMGALGKGLAEFRKATSSTSSVTKEVEPHGSSRTIGTTKPDNPSENG